jgi:hypothetical protein
MQIAQGSTHALIIRYCSTQLHTTYHVVFLQALLEAQEEENVEAFTEAVGHGKSYI